MNFCHEARYLSSAGITSSLNAAIAWSRFLSASSFLAFCLADNIGLPVLGNDFKQFPLLGRTETLFDFRDLRR